MKARFVVVMLSVALMGCSGLDTRDQKVVSGMAIGGTLACWPGSIVGAGIGYIVGHDDE